MIESTMQPLTDYESANRMAYRLMINIRSTENHFYNGFLIFSLKLHMYTFAVMPSHRKRTIEAKKCDN